MIFFSIRIYAQRVQLSERYKDTSSSTNTEDARKVYRLERMDFEMNLVRQTGSAGEIPGYFRMLT